LFQGIWFRAVVEIQGLIMSAQNTSEYAVGWFTLSLINAGLAQSKGRSGLNWWFLSLLLGPICTFLIVATDPIKPK
jgi:hypothetical protein